MKMTVSLPLAAFDDAWATARHGLPGGGWLQEMRMVAFNRFRQLGLPSPRDEAWRYADLKPLARGRFTAETEAREPDPALLVRAAIPGHDGPLLVFVNGRLSLAASRLDSLPQGLTVRGLRQTLTFGGGALEPIFAELRDGDAFDQLNTALLSDGCVIEAPAGLRFDHPIAILHILDGDAQKAIATRTLIRLQQGAALRIIESFVGTDASFFASAIDQIELEDGASLHLMRRQHSGSATSFLGRCHVRLAAAQFRLTAFAVGGFSAREEARISFTRPGGEAMLDIAQIVSGERTLDCNITVDHAVPDCKSRQRYRGILGRNGKGSIEAGILVREGAQHSDARQHLQSLLLDRTAEANAKPELRIFADDVICAHGATVGEIDRDQLFYLVSRGIAPAEARLLLVEGFVAGLLEDVGDEGFARLCLDDLAAVLDAGRSRA